MGRPVINKIRNGRNLIQLNPLLLSPLSMVIRDVAEKRSTRAIASSLTILGTINTEVRAAVTKYCADTSAGGGTRSKSSYNRQKNGPRVQDRAKAAELSDYPCPVCNHFGTSMALGSTEEVNKINKITKQSFC
jgi:hypothetical protein